MSGVGTFLCFDGKIYLHLAYGSPDVNSLMIVFIVILLKQQLIFGIDEDWSLNFLFSYKRF